MNRTGWRGRCAVALIAALFALVATDAMVWAAGSKIVPVRGQFYFADRRIEEFHCVPTAAGKSPVVMLVHGCAPDGFGAREFRHLCTGLAEHGYYAMFVEYYSLTGAPNCRDLAMLSSVSLAPEIPLPDDTWMRELLAARESLADNPRADPSQLGMVGFSFGATLAVITAALNPGVIRAIVDYYGFSNPKVEEAVAKAANFPPTLILQGDADSRAHVTDSIHLFHAIAKEQKASEIHVYPQVEHGFNFRAAPGYDADATADAWSRTLEFLDRYLK